jgi:hypothetical protein
MAIQSLMIWMELKVGRKIPINRIKKLKTLEGICVHRS